MLALDPPGDPTIGACLAGNLSGPRRHRYGAPRDLVLGVTVVLADGTIASAGGKVVKNVAGYDLGKLFCGSRGSARPDRAREPSASPAPREAAQRSWLPWRARTRHTLAGRLVHSSALVPSAVDLLWQGRRLAARSCSSRARSGRSRRRSTRRARCSAGRRPRTTSGTRREAGRRARAAGSRFRRAGSRRRSAMLPGGARPSGRRRRRTPMDAVSDAARGGRGGARRARARGVRPPGVLVLMDRELVSECVHCGFCLPTCPT